MTALERVLEPLANELTQQAGNKNLYWDLTGIQQMDTAGTAMLWRIWKAQRPQYLQLRPEHEKMFKRLENLPNLQPGDKQRDLLWPITTLGRLALLLWQHTLGLIILIGQLLIDVIYLIRHPIYIPWREISANLYRTGAQALGITALVGFLIGIVISYLSSKQLQLFGADIFIINILGISIIRESVSYTHLTLPTSDLV